ncbi:MAG: hypothetical protein JNL81_10835 [Hyphomonadaceae bacterium]|nr:hypothetical protein [Hyphomonadaceae bacterium]
MAKTNPNTDPYAPPPMHHDKSGAVVRVAILGGLLGAAALGYAWMAGQPQTASLVPEQAAQEQQMADAGYQVADPTLPEATSEALPPAPAPTAAPAPQRRSAPARRAPAPTPEPEAVAPPTAAPLPAAPTPLPPVDMPPPSGTIGG